MKNFRFKHILKLTVLFFALSTPFISYTQSEMYLPKWEVSVNFRFLLEFDQDVPPLLLKYYLGKEKKSALRFTLNPDLVLSSGYVNRPYNVGRFKTFLHDEYTWVIEKALNIHVGIGWEKYAQFNKFSINRGVNVSWGYKDITLLSERYIGGSSNGNGEK